MAKHHLDFAQLDEENLAKLRKLESKLGASIVAFEPLVELAELTEEQLEQFDQYQRGQLSGEEARVFESRLQGDKDFRETFDQYLESRTARQN